MIDFKRLQTSAKLFKHPENYVYRILSINRETNTCFCVYQIGDVFAKGPISREIIEGLHWKKMRKSPTKKNVIKNAA